MADQLESTVCPPHHWEVTSVRIEGAPHEFTSLPNVVEDVVDIILNLKKVKFKAPDHEPRPAGLPISFAGCSPLPAIGARGQSSRSNRRITSRAPRRGVR